MINPQELQIGNYLKYESNVEVITSIIHPSSDPIDESRGWLVQIRQPNPAIVRLADCEPIELTKEILIDNCYFEEINEMIAVLKINSNTKFSFISDRFFSFDVRLNKIDFLTVPIKNIKYLHQLQNFKMAVTGSELIVTPF